MSENGKAVFLSYASQDADVAKKICDALRAAGVEVWFDQNELRGGEAWDKKIKAQIRECTLFLPIISVNTQARQEGYFRLEWHLAEQRSLLIARGRPFLVPVSLGTTTEREALVPEAFLAVQWTRLPDRAVLPALVAQVRHLLTVGATPVGSGPTGNSAAEVARPGPLAIPDFELLREIGKGAYGDVWLARGLTGVYRAIKIVRRDRFASAEPFEREFNGLKKFHAMVLPEASQLALLHVGQNIGAGFFYYVMELADDVVTGREVNPAAYVPLTLREVRARRGRLPAAECVNYGVELARALAGLHARGLVHRDIKPSNVILVGGVPKLADIGLVAAASEALTYVGTDGFVPPEGPGKPSADVFALGRLLYELATGFDRDQFPRLPPDLNQVADRQLLFQLNEIILRACEPAVERRYRDASAMLVHLLAIKSGGSVRRPWFRRRAMGWAAALIVAVSLVWFGLATRRDKTNPAPLPVPAPTAPILSSSATIAGKSIAVLPFENLSDNQDNAFLADGIHEEILTNLSNIASLRVISRTSVMQYRGTTKKIGQIARELGVDYILEGSVRRAGSKVRVTGQLIRASTDANIWAKAYDGDLTDILALQVQVATTIATQLEAVLTPEETKRLNAITLANPTAYELYLKVRDLRRQSNDAMGIAPEAEGLIKRATELDPNFALAWVELASVHISLYFQGKNAVNEREEAKSALDRAVALAPDRAEVQTGLGEYYYYGFLDYDNAALHYQKALVLEPSSAKLHNLLGLLARRQVRWPEAAAELRAAHRLDPLNRAYANTLRTTLNWMRDYAAARDVALTLLQSDPDNIKYSFDVAFLNANLTRSRQPFDDWFAAQSPARRATPEFKDLRSWVAFQLGDAAEYLRLVEADGPASLEAKDEDTPLQVAIARRVLGRENGEALAQQRHQLEGAEQSDPGNAGLWQQLAVTCALQGDRSRADYALQRATEKIQPEKNPLDGYNLDVTRAQVFAWLGDKDAAVDLLKRLTKLPGPELHPIRLKWSLDWWPLRGDPRFEALVKEATNPGPVAGDLAPGGHQTGAAPTDSSLNPSLLTPQILTPSNPPAADAKSVAVLAFTNLSGDKENEYFSDGISEELLNVLAKIPRLKVSARTSAFHFKGKDTGIAEIARQLGVAYVVEGSVRKQGTTVRITAQLIKAADGFHVWSDTFTPELKDIFAVQDEIADLIAQKLSVQLRAAPAGEHRVADPEAYRLLLLARYQMYRGTREELALAFQNLQLALGRDEKFAPALTQESIGHFIAASLGWEPYQQAFETARSTAQRALALQPDLATAHDALGLVAWAYDWDWATARKSFERAQALAPGSAEIASDLVRLALTIGSKEEAVRLGRVALSLDPLDVPSLDAYWRALYHVGEFDALDAQLKQYGTLIPAAAPRFQIYSAVLRGKKEDALAFANQVEEKPWRLVYLSLAQAATGKIVEADANLAELKAKFADLAAYQIAELYAWRELKDEAFQWLETTYQQRDPGLRWVRNDPLLQKLHADPRWTAFLGKMNPADAQ